MEEIVNNIAVLRAQRRELIKAKMLTSAAIRDAQTRRASISLSAEIDAHVNAEIEVRDAEVVWERAVAELTRCERQLRTAEEEMANFT